MPTSVMEPPTPALPPPNNPSTSLKPLTKALKLPSESVTLIPILSPSHLPRSLLKYLHSEFSAEIARGCTYPMEQAMELDLFEKYWFGSFGVVALLDKREPGRGSSEQGERLLDENRNWEEECLGTFYIRPNYPGRCSHVCNAGFLTTSAARGRGVGRVMGETYLEYAPKLGYKYSVFNLVFANNIASIKIWDRLGFNVIGRVPGAARLENSEELVDALIYGRELA